MIICCNYFYINVKWPLTRILIGGKAHLLEDKQISSVGIFDEAKNDTILGVGLSPNLCILWLDFTQSRFFCHFRYFWEEFHKRSDFGRFWSIKVKKTTKSQKHVENSTWRRQTHNVTPSRVEKIGGYEDYSWRAKTIFKLGVDGVTLCDAKVVTF